MISLDPVSMYAFIYFLSPISVNFNTATVFCNRSLTFVSLVSYDMYLLHIVTEGMCRTCRTEGIYRLGLTSSDRIRLSDYSQL